jgi:hypothetical protein
VPSHSTSESEQSEPEQKSKYTIPH